MFAYDCKSLTVLADSDVTVRHANYYNAAAPVHGPVDVFYDNYVLHALKFLAERFTLAFLYGS